MRVLTTAILCLSLTTAGAYAAKPEWAGQENGKEKAEKVEQSGKAAKHEKALKEEKAEKVKQSADKAREDKADKADKADKMKGKNEQKSREFGEHDKDVIRSYYASEEHRDYEEHRERAEKEKKPKNLPPGLAKKLERGGELPPGWQTKLERGEVLDADVRASAHTVPDQLIERLPVDPLVEEVVRVQDKVIRMSRGEGTIIDVIDIADVLAGRRMRE